MRISDWSSDVCSSDLADTGYQGLKFEEYIIAYGSKFPDLAGTAAEGASSWLYALPAEDGGAVHEQAAYLEWMAQTAPDAALDSLAAQGWASSSEERRVGEDGVSTCSYQWSQYHLKKKHNLHHRIKIN